MAPPATTGPLATPPSTAPKDEFGDDIAYVPPPRPVLRPEESEPDRSDWTSLAKAVALGVVAIGLLGWLLRH